MYDVWIGAAWIFSEMSKSRIETLTHARVEVLRNLFRRHSPAMDGRRQGGQHPATRPSPDDLVAEDEGERVLPVNQRAARNGVGLRHERHHLRRSLRPLIGSVRHQLRAATWPAGPRPQTASERAGSPFRLVSIRAQLEVVVVQRLLQREVALPDRTSGVADDARHLPALRCPAHDPGLDQRTRPIPG